MASFEFMKIIYLAYGGQINDEMARRCDNRNFISWEKNPEKEIFRDFFLIF